MSWRDGLDALNLNKGAFQSSNDFGIPDMKKQDFEVKNLIPYRVNQDRNGTAHFYLDDYRFERCWNNPLQQLKSLKEYEGVLTPDFSMYLDYPKALQVWQTYRNRWLGCYWQQEGFQVIPTIGWSDKSSFEFAFLGVEKHSTVSVGTVGILKDKNTVKLFLAGFEEMLRRIEPSCVLVYGNKIRELEGISYIKWFQPYSSKWNKEI
ncbi:MAG: hypothetical protein UR30_C0005G0105 [Candidatus Peregrinibacteria bacterium GW2011_GWC2_33_13]|nr:MAG: hypothetical protein UR30_C0005G0105 [Candidatus Peregrinibacteria bacterium GW2011_GWC2_33_13]